MFLKNFAFGSLSFLVIAVLAWIPFNSYVVSPIEDRNIKASVELEKLKKKNEALNALRDQYRKLDEDVAALKKKDAELRNLLPSEDAVVENFRLLQSTASAKRLTLIATDGKHAPYRPGVFLSPLKLSLAGKTQDHSDYLRFLAEYPRLLLVRKMEMVGDGSGQSTINLDLDLGVFIPSEAELSNPLFK
jgi:Tfp pilus assembly protein PilO